MAIEGFDEITNTLYIAKRLYDMGKYDLAKASFSDILAYDFYFENMYTLIENLFAFHQCRYFERRYVELHILSDPVLVDFYILAGEYGRRNNIPDETNPYIKSAEQQVRKRLNFSYCLDWKLMGYTEPKRPFHSRLGLIIYQDDYMDLGMLAYQLLELYEWLSEQCSALNKLLADNSHEEALAA